MQIINSLDFKDNKPHALAIGNFDGVHLGHQKIVNKLIKKSKQLNLTPALITFSPHPKCFFRSCDNFLLTTDKEKAEALEKLYLEKMYLIAFNKEFSKLTAEQFIQKIVQNLNLKYLLVGDDFKFGANSQGDYKLLKKASEKYNFEIERVDTFNYLSEFKNERISSSLIRKAILENKFDKVEKLLGKKFSYKSNVIKGNQIGRNLGFPTANLNIEKYKLIPNGVFAVFVKVDNVIYKGVCNVGRKPTVSNLVKLVEVHIFNFDFDIYGESIEVSFVKKIREEGKFNSLNDLKEQIEKDKQKAKKILKLYSI